MFSWIISGLKICRKGVAYAPIRAHYHRMITIFWGSTRRARPRRALGRQLSASSTGSRRRWDRFVELMARSNALESEFRSPARRHVPATCAPELGRARRRNVVAAPRGPGGPCGHRGGHPTRAPWCELGLQSVDCGLQPYSLVNA